MTNIIPEQGTPDQGTPLHSKTAPTDRSRRSFLGKMAATAAAIGLARIVPGSVAEAATAKAWASGMNLDIQFSVATKAGAVKRPYVAVWIEDSSGKTIRNLTVWLNTRNMRWINEGLRRWIRDNSGLIGTATSPTRSPGTYSVAWDGKTDKGTAAAQGDYYVCVESGREHGPYSLVRQKVTIGSAAFKKSLGADGDIEAVNVSFVKS